jgi:hypothetical protein
MERVSAERITDLKENEVFVFGSNTGGRHGAGAAKMAYDRWGAIYGVSQGLQGKSYAIPTKDDRLNTLSIPTISAFVRNFTIFASENPQLKFLVTEIGCGLAGLRPSEVGPLFKDCLDLENVYLPKSFLESLKGKSFEFDFYFDHDNRWYVDLPSWPGEKEELEMVMGADLLLDILSDGSYDPQKRTRVRFTEFSFEGSSCLTHTGDGYYDNDAWHGPSTVWLCHVTEFVFGYYPDKIYYRRS